MKKTVPLAPTPREPQQDGANGQLIGRPQKGVDAVFQPRVTPEVLRRMDHAEWLELFAKTMQLQTGVEMTPMRAGVISRCNLAAEFIRMITSENRALEKQRDEARTQLARASRRRAAIRDADADQDTAADAADQRADHPPGPRRDEGGKGS